MPQIAQQDYIKLPMPADENNLTKEEYDMFLKHILDGTIYDCILSSPNGDEYLEYTTRIIGCWLWKNQDKSYGFKLLSVDVENGQFFTITTTSQA